MNAFKKLAMGIAVAALVLAGSEFLLRLGGVDVSPRQHQFVRYSTLYFVGTRERYRPMRFVKDRFLWLPPTSADSEFSDSEGFRNGGFTGWRGGAEKARRDTLIWTGRTLDIPDERTYRILVLGGSTTEGGYHPWPEHAGRILNASDPARRYEVLNAACSGYSSFQNRLRLPGLVRLYEPDLVVVYDGWNDFSAWADGYSDSHKDRFVRSLGHPAVPKCITSLRLSRLSAALAQRLDFGWPHLRVMPEEYEANLEAMVGACESNGVPILLVLRPYCNGPREPGEHEEELAALYGPDFYGWKWTQAVDRAASVVSRHPFARTACLWRFMDELTNEAAILWAGDGMHLKPLGDQRVGEFMAVQMVPSAATAVWNLLRTPEYWLGLAEEYLSEGNVEEARFCSRNAVERGADTTDLDRRIAESGPFWDLFREGQRWTRNGFTPQQKLDCLLRCAEMRPDDVGVQEQIALLRRDAGL